MLETGTSSNRRTPSTRLMTREGISLLRAASTTRGVTSTYVKCLESNMGVESAPQNQETHVEDCLGPWFKVAVSVTADSDGPETYLSRCIGRISADTQNKVIKIPKNY